MPRTKIPRGTRRDKVSFARIEKKKKIKRKKRIRNNRIRRIALRYRCVELEIKGSRFRLERHNLATWCCIVPSTSRELILAILTISLTSKDVEVFVEVALINRARETILFLRSLFIYSSSTYSLKVPSVNLDSETIQ